MKRMVYVVVMVIVLMSSFSSAADPCESCRDLIMETASEMQVQFDMVNKGYRGTLGMPNVNVQDLRECANQCPEPLRSSLLNRVAFIESGVRWIANYNPKFHTDNRRRR